MAVPQTPSVDSSTSSAFTTDAPGTLGRGRLRGLCRILRGGAAVVIGTGYAERRNLRALVVRRVVSRARVRLYILGYLCHPQTGHRVAYSTPFSQRAHSSTGCSGRSGKAGGTYRCLASACSTMLFRVRPCSCAALCTRSSSTGCRVRWMSFLAVLLLFGESRHPLQRVG